MNSGTWNYTPEPRDVKCAICAFLTTRTVAEHEFVHGVCPMCVAKIVLDSLTRSAP